MLDALPWLGAPVHSREGPPGAPCCSRVVQEGLGRLGIGHSWHRVAPTRAATVDREAWKGYGARRPVGLQSKSPVGMLEGLRKLIGRAIASAEELVFLVFFVAFVAFAIGGFLLIYLG